MVEKLYGISYYQYNTPVSFTLPEFSVFDAASNSYRYGSHRLTLTDAGGNVIVEEESSTSRGDFSVSIKSTQALSVSTYTLRVDATNALKSASYNFVFKIFDGSQLTRNQTLTGTSSADIMLGGSGNDEIVGGEADDDIRGNEGDDSLSGGNGDDTIDGGSGDDEIVGGEADDDIRGSEGDDSLSGGNGNDTINGGTGHNVLSGGKGDDVLTSHFGTDVLIGGKGDDTYVVDGYLSFNVNPDTIEDALAEYRVEDVLIEYDGEGVDTVQAWGSWILGSHFENLRMSSGPEGQFAIGNQLDNDIVVSGYGFDYIDGGAGADTMSGGRGSDIYIVDNVGDRVIDEMDGEFTYTDEVRASVSYSIEGTLVENLTLTGTANINGTGSSDKNSIIGNGGSNTLDGKAGADLLTGLGGNDTYVVDDAGDQVIEAKGGGNDTVGALASYVLAAGQEVETLRLMAATGGRYFNLTGNEFDQALVGNSGRNLLDGGAGADVMSGARGDDTYVVDNAADRVIEVRGGGNDTVGTLTSYVLAAGQEVETLRLMAATGNRSLNLTGNEFNQALVGNIGNNVLDGGAGADVMSGARGNDTYLVDDAADRVVEVRGAGTDTVGTLTSYVLAAGQEIETLRLVLATGNQNLDLTGNEYGQAVTGNGGANVLDGRFGNDVLAGGKGADTFVFSTALGTGNVDRITDFAGEDTLRLSKSVFAALASGELAAGAFKTLGTGSVDADDRILYDRSTGEIFYDADGSGKAAAVKFAVLDNKATLTHADVFVA